MTEKLFYTNGRPSQRTRRRAIFWMASVIVGVLLFYASTKVIGKWQEYQLQKVNEETIAKISAEHIIENQREPDTATSQEIIEPSPEETTATVPEVTTPDTHDAPIPERAYLEVPFTPQAPFANWDALHEAACEEAAILQVQYYLTDTPMTPESADQDIVAMVDWQVENLGSHHDIYADEVKVFLMGYYGYREDQIRVLYDVSVEELQTEIANGHPIIAPITGHLLKNPYYQHPGYHMLTIIGYTEDRFITNDVGTRRGKDFSYEYDRFMSAMKDAGGDVVIIDP